MQSQETLIAPFQKAVLNSCLELFWEHLLPATSESLSLLDYDFLYGELAWLTYVAAPCR